jgi:hypothetical protein
MALIRRLLGALLLTLPLSAVAQHRPYFVTYNHEMEEVGNLEMNSLNVVGSPRVGNTFWGSQAEFEYGAANWWSTALYLDGQTTANESTVFTGYRIENRFKPLKREHWINPVLYFEFAHINEANKSLREIVGHDVEEDQAEPNSITHGEVEKEIELKLILSSHVKGWNISENFITERPLVSGDPWEFGYAFGFSRPLAFAPSANPCSICRENMTLGAEFYGGLGDTNHLSTHNTSHYVAPVFAWQFSPNANMRISPGFGLNDQSHRVLTRFSLTYEINGFGSKVTKLFQ